MKETFQQTEEPRHIIEFREYLERQHGIYNRRQQAEAMKTHQESFLEASGGRTAELAEEPIPVRTVEELAQLHSDLAKQLGIDEGLIRHKDCPSSEYVAGYYIAAYRGIDRAIHGINAALSGQYLDLRAFPGDGRVLEILKGAAALQADNEADSPSRL